MVTSLTSAKEERKRLLDLGDLVLPDDSFDGGFG